MMLNLYQLIIKQLVFGLAFIIIQPLQHMYTICILMWIVYMV